MSDARDRAANPVTPSFHNMARMFNLTLATIRKAQGKLNPSDLEPGTLAWRTAVDEFADDLIRYGYMAQLDKKNPA